MRRFWTSAVLAAAVAGISFMPAGDALGQLAGEVKKDEKSAPADVPVKVVVLFSSGVGYFEHGGAVNGNTSTELRFKTQQINDILKSLLLQDLGGGMVRSVVYPSQDPIEKTLRSFQVDITGNPSLAELLGQLRGAKVQVVTNAGETLDGTILGVEQKPKAVGGDKGPINVWVINLISGGTIRSVELGETKKIELADKQLQEELAKALTALAQARDQDKKPVTIHFAGQGERQVRIGYVVETPIWKTSYRLVLPGQGAAADVEKKGDGAKPAVPDPKADKPKLLGWAIVENQTDNDWGSVQLSLVSGRPISFIQDLYRPLYIPRPVVQPELYASLRPQTYEAGMGGEGRLAEAEQLQQQGARQNALARNKAKSDEARKFAPAPSAPPGAASGAFALGAALADGESDKDMYYKRLENAAASVQSVASASKVGELFQYTVGNVSLPRQQSAMIPIITDDVEIEKLSIYNPAVLARNPLYGAKVKNTTGKHLLQGPITVIEGAAYAGDARIDNVPPGQERLISYGIDLQMLVDAKNNKQEDTVIAGKIVKGVLWLTHKQIVTQDYVAENKGDQAKTLVVEHAFRPGWKLIAPEKFQEKTDVIYRFRQGVAPGKQEKVTVTEENVRQQAMALLPADVGQIMIYAKTDRIPKAVKDALIKAVELKNAMTDTQRQIAEYKKQIVEITAEQNRIRSNIQIADRNTDYGIRMLKKLDDQETQIEKLQASVKESQASFETQRKALEDYLSATTVE